jgi:transcriptional regulator with XRE-family HTH domain
MIESSKRTKLVGEFIRKQRETLGMSQRALGLLFTPPVTTQFISNVERGVTPLPPNHIPILAKALQVSDAEIMTLLEKEYALKLNGRLGKSEEELKSAGSSSVPSVVVANADYEFIKSLYDAYQTADVKTRETFTHLCENILKLPRSSDSSGTSGHSNSH